MKRLKKRAYYGGGSFPADLGRWYMGHFDCGSKVLDVGCGVGVFGPVAQERGVELHGIDIDEGALQHARGYSRLTALDLDEEAIPYPDDFFDGVVAKDVIEHVRDAGALVGEIARIVRPAGVIVASVVMAKPRVVWNDYTHVRGFTRAAVKLLFADAGLRVRHVRRMGGIPLTGRLRASAAVPYLLLLPGLSWWGSSWELVADA